MGQHLVDQNYYEILEVAPSAGQDEIHRAYQRARETYNPDSASIYTMFTREEAYEVLKLIDEAFQTLSNQRRRKDYDDKLKSKKASVAVAVAAPVTQIRMTDFSRKENMEDLPEVDFNPEIASIEQKTSAPSIRSNFVEPKPKADGSLPHGFRRTKFGVYEVDPKFEEIIAATTVFDGPTIQKIRLYKKVTLDHLAEETRISRTYLAAVETNDFSALPAVVFTRGFLVQVARLLGLDSDRVVKSYMELFKQGQAKN